MLYARSYLKLFYVGLAISGFAVLGTILVGALQAATYTATIEAETGQIVGNASKRAAEVGASGNAAVRFGVTAPTPPTPPPATPPTLKIMPLGDSITYGVVNDGSGKGWGSYRESLWQKITADGYKVDFVGSQKSGQPSLPDTDNEGHQGLRIDELDAQVIGWMTTYQPDVVLLHAGTNDIVNDYTANEMLQQLDKIMQDIYSVKPNVKLVVATLIPVNCPPWHCPVWQQYNNATVPAMIKKYNDAGRKAYLADMSKSGIVENYADLVDGIHPSAAAYSRMSNVWYPVIKPFFITP